MKKKILSAVFVSAIIVTIAITFSACIVGNGGEGVHRHRYGGDWLTDEAAHWKECACGEASDFIPHTFDNGVVDGATGAKVLICTVCGYQKTEMSTGAAKMQKMLDELIADFNIPANPPFEHIVQAFQRTDFSTPDLDKYYNPANANEPNGAKYEDTFKARFDEIDNYYNSLTTVEKNAPGMSGVKKNFDAFKQKMNDYRLVSRWVTDVDALFYLLIMSNPNPLVIR